MRTISTAPVSASRLKPIPTIATDMLSTTGPIGLLVEITAAPMARSQIADTASHASPERSEPSQIGMPMHAPSSTTRIRCRRDGASPTTAAGRTPNASAKPFSTSKGMATTAGTE